MVRLTTKGTPLLYPNKRRLGNWSAKGKRWKLSEESKRRHSKASKLRWKNGVYNNVDNPTSKGKRWKLSKESKQRHRNATLNSWKNGTYRTVPMGRGKTGVRKDIGHFVRSTWEANFARVLRYHGIEYQYEPRRFNIGYMTYTPDFYIPKFDLWIEVKGYDTNKARNKRKRFRKKYGVRLVVVKAKTYGKLYHRYSRLIPQWEG